VDVPVREDAGDHAFEQGLGDQGVGRSVGLQRLACVFHVQPRRERDHPPRQRQAPVAEGQGDGDGQVPACGVADRRDVGRRDPLFRQRRERCDTVIDLRGVRVLGRPTVVEDEGDDAERLGQVRRQLSVAGRGADGEAAAVRVEQHL